MTKVLKCKFEEIPNFVIRSLSERHRCLNKTVNKKKKKKLNFNNEIKTLGLQEIKTLGQ